MKHDLKIYNTLSQSIVPFESIEKGVVNMYVCGPTVYDHIHIGNARPVIVFDTIKRILKTFGYRVNMVSNITDVDDKIIEKAKQLNVSEEEITKEYIQAYKTITHQLGSELPDHMPKATEFIDHMIRYIQTLIDKDFAYETSQGVYFRVHKVDDYGVLSKQNQDQLETAVRVSLDDEKEHPRDFSIWKKTMDGLHFDSPWGLGRPGWHTECAVMNHEIFDGMIDIHGGGSDLMFPHHENERAHACAHDHHGLAKYWMHNGRLDIDAKKMSKSLGNVIRVKDLNEEHLKAFRMLILAHHYRQPIQYSEALFEEYIKIFNNIEKKLKMTSLELKNEDIKTYDILEDEKEKTYKILAKDFDTPNLITEIYQMIKNLNKAGTSISKAVIMNTILWQLSILGLDITINPSTEDLNLYQDWVVARTNKQYEVADELRKKLMEKGYL
jgi:cysteinyl-tRNA synthetase